MSAQPVAERPQDRLLDGGAAALSDGELLAVLLGRRVRGVDAVASARALLEDTDGLQALLSRNARELSRASGIGPAGIARLHAAVELGRRFIEAPALRARSLENPLDAARCFRARFADLQHEVFACLFLDNRHRVIRFETLFRGTIDGATVYPREVLKRALHHNAAAVIAGHNHPSGICDPSEADRSITSKLKQSLALLDIRLLDHLIVSRNGHLSLAEHGWL